MAVLTFNPEKNQISIIVEKEDLIRTVKEDHTTVVVANAFGAGHMFAKGDFDMVIIRGERK